MYLLYQTLIIRRHHYDISSILLVLFLIEAEQSALEQLTFLFLITYVIDHCKYSVLRFLHEISLRILHVENKINYRNLIIKICPFEANSSDNLVIYLIACIYDE